MLQAKVVSTLQEAAANRGSLSGVSWVASTTFENVDVWAFDRMDRLNADPLAGISLHQKLVAMQLASNSMVMDPERLAAFGKFVRVKGRGSELDALLQGSEGSDAQTADLFMPVASNNEFSYEDISTSAKVKSSAIAGFAESMMDNTAPQQNK
jgi:hypothetical protein